MVAHPMNTFVRIALVALLPICLGGCFEVTEDILVRKDESAQVVLEITVSGSLAMLAGDLDKNGRDPFGDNEKLVRELKATEGVSGVKHSEKKDGTKRIHRLEMNLENYRMLQGVGDLLMKHQKERLVGTSFTVQDIPPSSARVTQRLAGHPIELKTSTQVQGVPLNSLMAGKEGEARDYLLGRLKDKYIYVTLRAPEIGDHNGESNKSGTMVSWEIPVSAVLESSGKSIDLAADITVSKDDRPLWKRLLFFWR
jgi:hypothetical protein